MSDHVMELQDTDEVDSVGDDDQCIICQQPTARTCALCNDIMICGMHCQQIAVIDDVNSDHFNVCVPDTTADTLYKDVLSNRIPRDEQTFWDFGFAFLFGLNYQRKLLEIYATIIRKMDITPREMEIWVKEYRLFERIAMLFLCRPELISLDDLKWLKRTALYTVRRDKAPRDILEYAIARKHENLQ